MWDKPHPPLCGRALCLVHMQTEHANMELHGARHTPFAPTPLFTCEQGAHRKARTPPPPHFHSLPPFAHKGGAGKVCPPFLPPSAPIHAQTGHVDATGLWDKPH